MIPKGGFREVVILPSMPRSELILTRREHNNFLKPWKQLSTFLSREKIFNLRIRVKIFSLTKTNRFLSTKSSLKGLSKEKFFQKENYKIISKRFKSKLIGKSFLKNYKNNNIIFESLTQYLELTSHK